MQDEGFEVTYLPVSSEGLINLDDLKKAIRKDTVLVSIMAVNNEIGVIQPLKEIGKICRENKVFSTLMLLRRMVRFLLMLTR